MKNIFYAALLAKYKLKVIGEIQNWIRHGIFEA